MGLIGNVLGAGTAARQIGEAVGQFGAEFAAPAATRFDGFVNGLNRLPRPLLALGTLGLFAYAMAEPTGFSVRMQGLGFVPEPLWWLLGAIVSFYFGARELHHQRGRAAQAAPRTAAATAPALPMPIAALGARPAASRAIDPDHNPAVEEWRRQHP